MAQLLQPGNEGDDEKKESESEYGSYQCIFRQANDSLYLMMKDRKTKRSFNNTFSKSTLVDMDLKQSIDKILILLETAKLGEKSELKWSIGFGDAENNKKVSVDQLSKSYVKGYALYIIVSIEQAWFTAEYAFKLLEQKRSETDIIHDIIADMQTEIDMLKNKITAMPGMAVYKSSGNTKTSPITWDIESKAPTIEGMVSREESNKKIVVGVAGTYRLTVRFGYNGTCNNTTNHGLYVSLNGTEIAKSYSMARNAGNVIDILELSKGDKFQVTASCQTSSNHSWDRKLNLFMLEKL